MKQLTYKLLDGLDYEQALELIGTDDAYASANSRLVILMEPVCRRELLEERIADAARILPDAQLVGMTTLGPISDLTDVPDYTVVSALLFEEADVEVFSRDCHETSTGRVGEQLCERLHAIDDPKGILLMTSCVELTPVDFLDIVSSRFPDVPIFGNLAGTEVIGEDNSLIVANGEVYDRGLFAVVFSGAGLHVMVDHNLGWLPLGKELAVTESTADGVVNEIDGKPAINIYQKYLEVEPDEYYYANVCSFPLLARSGKLLVARVPNSYLDDGSLTFNVELPKDTRLTLSYTKPEYLLKNSLRSANAMVPFAPQAIMLYACINRRVYMGNERSDHEFDYYRNVCPSMFWVYGYGEIYKSRDGGSLLNSTIVAVAMREGEPDLANAATPYEDSALAALDTPYKPLSERLVTFLEATTAELRETIGELETLAQRDQLTGIYNRRRTDELIEYKLQRRRRGDDVALLMYDIDHFKRINDTWGHETGDLVLKELTRRVSEVIRSDDVLGRWGGEEFLIVVTETALDQARFLAERVRRHVEQTVFPTVGTVTISVGVTCAEDGDTVESLFNRVDKALYDAKNAGRNRVEVR